MMAIVETNKLHIDNIFENYQINEYSVDSTKCSISFSGEQPPYTIEILTEEQFEELKLTPEWNHNLIQDNS
jgi:hypothetical protein